MSARRATVSEELYRMEASCFRRNTVIFSSEKFTTVISIYAFEYVRVQSVEC